jgi:hypothetical protein
MSQYFALTHKPLPAALHGADAAFEIRTLSPRERQLIEESFSDDDHRQWLAPDLTAVVVPVAETASASAEDYGVLIEFGLGVLASSGFEPVAYVATVGPNKCSEIVHRGSPREYAEPGFPKKLVKTAPSSWIRRLFAARKGTPDKLHITAHRFVRYLAAGSTPDGLVDLCICLEFLIEPETEISFRFATCLAKATGSDTAESVSELLSDLYNLRSKVVHGVDFTKAHRRIMPNLTRVREAARAVLTAYVLYLSEHNKTEWKNHLKRALFI